MLNVQEIKLEIANLKADFKKTKTQQKKEALSKEIAKLDYNLKVVEAYETINIKDVVINGDPTKLGVVTAKEIQNQLPVVWVDWDGLTTSSVPNVLKIVPSEQLKWQWIENNYTRLYDRVSCDDMTVLIEELDRLKTEQKVLSSSPAVNLTSSPLDEREQNKIRQEKIIELWEDAIAFHYPLDEGFFLHNRKVVVKSYQLCKQHNLVFPVVFDGGHEHLAHPLELRKIPLGQLNIFPEDNTDPNEPEEETNSETSSGDGGTSTNYNQPNDLTVEENSENTSDFIIDPEFKNLLRPLTEEEYEQLEKNLIKDRCPVITVWKEHHTIIDGHHSYAIALQHDIPYTVREIELESRSAVIQWMYDLQLGRRNLSEEEKSYYRAKQYELLKQERGGDRNKDRINQYKIDNGVLNNDSRSKDHTDPLTKTPITSLNTAQIVAEKTKVSEGTVKRDAKYAKAVDAIAQKIGASPQEIINSPLSRKQVKEMVDLPVETIKQKLENPTFIEPRKLPELKVGDVVRIKSDRNNKDFVGYNGTIAICDRVYESSADIRVWQKLIPSVHKQFLQLIEEETVTLKVTLDKGWLKNLMATYNNIEEAIIPF